MGNTQARGWRSRLVVGGGFRPIPPHLWTLDRCARALGYPGLGAYFDGRYRHTAHSLPQLVAELGSSIWLVRAAMAAHRVPRFPGPEARGRACQVASDRHAAALGFPDTHAYLLDRYAQRAWPLPQLAAELGMGIRVLRRLLREHAVTRTRATAAQAEAGARGRALQAARHAAQRQARVASLGFATWPPTCGVRRVKLGWPIERIGARLGVGRRWLRAQLDRLELP